LSNERAFVYAVCGAAAHIRTLHRSLEYLNPRTRFPIIVVTDRRRNEIAIEPAASKAMIIDVETPARYDPHQASIFLKTSLHRFLPLERDYVYLDSDVIAVDASADSIFDQGRGPVTFAHDLTCLGHRVAKFSRWAVNCPCAEGRLCSHLAQAIAQKFGVRVPADWVHWNGGVFLFSRNSVPFMDMWHDLTMQIFDDRYWKTRDQGTLIATVWKLGLQHQACLPPSYNFLVADQNDHLSFSRAGGYSIHKSIPAIHPHFLHLFCADLDRPGWSLEHDVEDVLQARTESRAASQQTGARLRRVFSTISGSFK
jgi:hypothetical protein